MSSRNASVPASFETSRFGILEKQHRVQNNHIAFLLAGISKIALAANFIQGFYFCRFDLSFTEIEGKNGGNI